MNLELALKLSWIGVEVASSQVGVVEMVFDGNARNHCASNGRIERKEVRGRERGCGMMEGMGRMAKGRRAGEGGQGKDCRGMRAA